MHAAFQWAGRILGVAVVAFVLLFAVGEGFELGRLSLVECISAAVLLIACLGMVATWKWQLGGGITSVSAMAAFYLIHFLQSGRWGMGWVFPLFFLPGVLALVSVYLRRRLPPQPRG